MASGTATLVGFGFGPIQAGLFLLEAQRSGAFGRLVVAEVVPAVVDAVRAAGGRFAVNVAHADRVEVVTVGPVTLENSAVAADRARLVEAIAAAQEIATAVPSVQVYRGDGPAALNRVLAAGLRRKAVSGGPRAVVYAAENRTDAAARLRDAVMEEVPAAEQAAVAGCVCFVDTVIAKMSGTGTPADGLAPATPGGERAFLVEAFNHILVTRPDFGPGTPPFVRGLAVFEEKADLQPFEEAKLYGHNAVHALAAYLGLVCGVETLADLAQQPGMMAFLRDALVQESGAGLRRRYAGQDPLFTSDGFAAYADDLLARMVNPYLRDTSARVGRDPARKLAWDDRLVGALRLAWAMGIAAERYALGVAAALDAWAAQGDLPTDPAAWLAAAWREAGADPVEVATIWRLVQTGRARLVAWRAAGCPDLAAWWAVQEAGKLEASR